jgi:hypothetical protein
MSAVPVRALIAVAITVLVADPSAGQAARVLSCETTFPADLTAPALRLRFGGAQVTDEEIHVGEGETEPGTVLFGNLPDFRIEILWQDVKRRERPRVVRAVGEKTRWATPTGLTLGLPLRRLEQLNGLAFRLLGFGWDYAGTVVDWGKGRLDAPPEAPCWTRARLGPDPVKPGTPARWRPDSSGLRDFESLHVN